MLLLTACMRSDVAFFCALCYNFNINGTSGSHVKMKYMGDEKMFEILSSCKPEELQQYAEALADQIQTAEEAEKCIRILWKRVPELTVQQEKELHQLGRKIRKRFHMKPIRA